MKPGEDPQPDSTAEPDIAQVRLRFSQLIAELRPQLHRYCARMTGSVFDGEDVAQEALVKAHHALLEMTQPPALRPWLFRIAHNVAMDYQKRYERRHVDLVAEVPERAEAEAESVDPELVQAALTVFTRLPPLQRSALILKDVLGHPLTEVASSLGTSVGATKAALSRARAAVVRVAGADGPSTHAAIPSAEEVAAVQRYVTFFNEQNWDGLRGLLSAEAELDLVARLQKRVVDAGYYHRYAQILETEPLRAEFGLVDGVPAVAMFRAPQPKPAYFVTITWRNGQVAHIRDFYHASYVANDANYRRWA